MANPTTNFGWVMPTSTDLVTDLPADFNVFGQGVDTSLQYLLGGTTGQVLSKTSNTNMAFTWVAQDDSNAIQNAIVDAKGDLIGATAADTPARLAVGTNGQVLTADSTAATGLAWASAGASFVGCTAYRSTAQGTQSIPTATVTVLTLPAEEYDTNTFHDNSTNNSRFTIPSGKAGKYEISVGMGYTASVSNAQQIRVLVNGSAYASFGYNASGIIADQRYATDNVWGSSAVITLAVADYLEFAAYHTHGSSSLVEFVRASITYLGA
jgi:hypothetical protein